MKVIPIVIVTDAMLSGASIAEPDTTQGEVAWTASTAYAIGDVRIQATTHRKYSCTKAIANTVTTPPESDTTNSWLDIGPTNRWAMFTQTRNTQSVQASGTPLKASVTPGQRTNAVFLGGLLADTIVVTMKDAGGTTVYSKTINGSTRGTTKWSEYFYGQFGHISSLFLQDLPFTFGATVSISLTANTGLVKCAAFVVGTPVFIGGMQYGAKSDALNFSTVTRDVFGNSILVPRRTVPKLTGTLILDKTLVNKARDMRIALNAIPAVWSVLDDNTDAYYESGVVLGVYKQFAINLNYVSHAQIDIDIEEI